MPNRNFNPKRSNQFTNKKSIYKLPFSKYETTVIIFGFMLIVFLMISLISAKINLGHDQQSLQNVTNETSQVHNNNNNLKQEISELQNDSRLQKIARQHGLKLNNKNVRNVRR